MEGDEDRITPLGNAIARLLDANATAVAALAWTSEQDRWAELVVCIVGSCVGWDEARSIVADFETVGLLRPSRLAVVSGADSEATSVARFVLREHGVSRFDIERLLRALARVGHVVHESFGGRVQKFIRARALEVATELEDRLRVDADQPELRVAIRLWFQNAFNLPVPVDHPALDRFLAEHDATLDDLVAAADRMDINLAVVDDLMRADLASRPTQDD